MTEELLLARTQMLKRNLLVTHKASTVDKTDLDLAETIDPDAWNVAFGQVSQKAQGLLWDISDLEKALGKGMAIEAAWKEYRRIRDETQQTCRDCFELVGGFALREKLAEDPNDRLLDRRVTAVTEAIAQVCRNAFDNLQRMLALPASTDAVSQTMARIVRARFPDWTVWTLPAAADEYARVVLHQIEPIKEAIDKERRDRLRSEGLTDRSARGQRRSSQLEAHLTTLFADAFATRVMGPAYAATMIVLRLDPLRAETDTMPSDRDRAATILAVTRDAYPASTGGAVGADTDAPWRFVRDQVASSWSKMCDEAGTTVSKRASNAESAEARADAFIERNSKALRNGIMPAALYPYDSFGECWKSASALATHWKKVINKEASDRPGVRGFRDVLNAAWICHIELPEQTPVLTNGRARRATRSCKRSLARSRPRSPTPGSPRTRPTNGSRRHWRRASARCPPNLRPIRSPSREPPRSGASGPQCSPAPRRTRLDALCCGPHSTGRVGAMRRATGSAPSRRFAMSYRTIPYTVRPARIPA